MKQEAVKKDTLPLIWPHTERILPDLKLASDEVQSISVLRLSIGHNQDRHTDNMILYTESATLLARMNMTIIIKTINMYIPVPLSLLSPMPFLIRFISV